MARKVVVPLHRVMTLALLGMLGTTLGGCASAVPSPSTRPSLVSSPSGPISSPDADAHFLLVLQLPKALWHTTETIEGTATLTLVGLSTMSAWGSGMGIVGFEFAEVGGNRKLSWLRTADCVAHGLDASTPLVSEITNASTQVVNGTASDFYGSGTDRLIHLPAGDWTVSAVTDFAEDSCAGPRQELRATVVIHVVA